MTGKYDNIIGLSRPESRRPKMTMNDRAAQFAPFAALTKFGEEIKESNRKTTEKIELGDGDIEKIDEVLTGIERRISENKAAGANAGKLAGGFTSGFTDGFANGLTVAAEYFVRDKVKSGGRVEEYIGNVKKIDRAGRKLIFEDGKIVDMQNLLSVSVVQNKQTIK